jgi:glutathione S-transferase
MLRILGRVTSINVRKVLWTADELDLAYVREDWGLPLRDPNVAEFLELNPNAQVPVLCDGDFVLWESAAIMRYLIQKFGPAHLLPEDVHICAMAEQWFSWQATDLNRSWSYAALAVVRKLPGYDDETQLAASIADWTAKMCIFENRLAETRAYAAGEAFSFADISLGLSVHRWFGGDFERPELPHVAAFYERVRTRPAARAHFDPATP